MNKNNKIKLLEKMANETNIDRDYISRFVDGCLGECVKEKTIFNYTKNDYDNIREDQINWLMDGILIAFKNYYKTDIDAFNIALKVKLDKFNNTLQLEKLFSLKTQKRNKII